MASTTWPTNNSVTSLNGETGALTLVAGSGISITPSGSNITIASTGGSGTVTSVAVAGGPQISVSGSPITTSGTITLGIPASVNTGATTINWAAGNVLYHNTSGNQTYTFTNSVDGQTIIFRLTAVGGAWTATFPSGIKWPNGQQPVQTASGTDIYTFINIGGTIYASVVQGLA